MTELLLIGFAMLSGFIGGVLYTRDVYRPMVELCQRMGWWAK